MEREWSQTWDGLIELYGGSYKSLGGHLLGGATNFNPAHMWKLTYLVLP